MTLPAGIDTPHFNISLHGVEPLNTPISCRAPGEPDNIEPDAAEPDFDSNAQPGTWNRLILPFFYQPQPLCQSQMRNDDSTPMGRPYEANIPTVLARRRVSGTEEATVTITYARHGPGDDCYEEKRKFTGGWDMDHPDKRLHFLRRAFSGATDLYGSSQYQIRPPLAGYRITLSVDDPFPGEETTGQAPFTDSDNSWIFVGSAVHGNSLQPCKAGPSLPGHCTFAMDGKEINPPTDYNIILIDYNTMEWVSASKGRVPPGRIAVDGGYEEDGRRLYHAVAQWNGTRVPGKTGEHLNGMQFGFGCNQYTVVEDYQLLCWRENVF